MIGSHYGAFSRVSSRPDQEQGYDCFQLLHQVSTNLPMTPRPTLPLPGATSCGSPIGMPPTLLDSSFLVWSQLSKSQTASPMVLQLLKDHTNKYNNWISFGEHSRIFMHVHWQPGLMHELPLLYLSTYQNTPVTVTCLPVHQANINNATIRISLCKIEGRRFATDQIEPSCIREQNVILNRFDASVVSFPGIKKRRVETKNQKYVIIADLIHKKFGILDRAVSSACRITSSRRFYKSENETAEFPVHTFRSLPGSSCISWNMSFASSNESSRNLFHAVIRGQESSSTLITMLEGTPIDLLITITGSNAMLTCVELVNLRPNSGDRIVHLRSGGSLRSISSQYVRCLFVESTPISSTYSPVAGRTCSQIAQLNVDNAEAASGFNQLRAYIFDESFNLVNRFDSLFPVIVSRPSPSNSICSSFTRRS